jgi:hypothetical protein
MIGEDIWMACPHCGMPITGPTEQTLRHYAWEDQVACNLAQRFWGFILRRASKRLTDPCISKIPLADDGKFNLVVSRTSR